MERLLAVLFLAAGLMVGCQSSGPAAGSTDPHGTYTPEEAKAAALQHQHSAPPPKAPGAKTGG